MLQRGLGCAYRGLDHILTEVQAQACGGRISRRIRGGVRVRTVHMCRLSEQGNVAEASVELFSGFTFGTDLYRTVDHAIQTQDICHICRDRLSWQVQECLVPRKHWL